jgi:ribosomal protein L31
MQVSKSALPFLAFLSPVCRHRQVLSSTKESECAKTLRKNRFLIKIQILSLRSEPAYVGRQVIKKTKAKIANFKLTPSCNTLIINILCKLFTQSHHRQIIPRPLTPRAHIQARHLNSRIIQSQ